MSVGPLQTDSLHSARNKKGFLAQKEVPLSLFLSLPFFASVCVDFVPSSVFCSSLFHLLSSFCPIHHFPPSFVSIIFLTIFSLVLPSSSPSLLFLPVSSPLPLCHFPAPSPPPTLLFLSPPSPRLPSRSPSLCDSLFFFFLLHHYHLSSDIHYTKGI